MGTRELFRKMKMFYYFDCGGGYKGIYICQNSSTCTFKMDALYFIISNSCYNSIKLIFLKFKSGLTVD